MKKRQGIFSRLLTSVVVLMVCILAGCSQVQQALQQEPGGSLDPLYAEEKYRQAIAYSNGIEVPQDYAKALARFHEAASAGSVPAMYMVGMSYYTGRGTTVDLKQAKRWLERAAEGGHVRAQYQLGLIYLDGEGVGRDIAWGVRWLGLAAYQGHARAQFSVGVCWSQGIGVPVDAVYALAWVIRARRQGLVEAIELEPVLMRPLSPQQNKQARKMAQRRLVLLDNWENSPTVLFAQQRLHEKGYSAGPVDGLIGAKTRTALRSFQTAEQLPSNGRLDELTLERLQASRFWETLLN